MSTTETTQTVEWRVQLEISGLKIAIANEDNLTKVDVSQEPGSILEDFHKHREATDVRKTAVGDLIPKKSKAATQREKR